MRDPSYPNDTLIINPWHSTCNNCGKYCFPEEKTHDNLAGWGRKEGDKGCGIEWKYVTSQYGGRLVDLSAEMRPDLKKIEAYRLFTEK